MNQKEIQKLNKIKNELVKTHKKCNGTGYFVEDGKSKKCECMKILAYLIDVVKSNIPLDYWNLNIKKLKIDKKFKIEVEKYILKIDNAIEKGIGVLFISKDRGVGKTSLACEIGKAAIKKRYSVYYNLLQIIISDKFSDNQEIIEKIKKSDLVIIDEIDKVAMRENSTLSFQIENFFRELLPSGKTIIMCSNMNIDEIENKLKIESLIKRYCKIISISGEDYSVQKNKLIDNLLEDKFDYFNDELLKSSEEFYQNENLYYEKKYYKNLED